MWQLIQLDCHLISIQSIAEKCGPAVSSAHLSLHAFTSYDSASCFKEKEKIKLFELMKEKEERMHMFTLLGCNWNQMEDLFQRLEKFVSYIFGQKNVSSVNAAHFNIFQTTG